MIQPTHTAGEVRPGCMVALVDLLSRSGLANTGSREPHHEPAVRREGDRLAISVSTISHARELAIAQFAAEHQLSVSLSIEHRHTGGASTLARLTEHGRRALGQRVLVARGEREARHGASASASLWDARQINRVAERVARAGTRPLSLEVARTRVEANVRALWAARAWARAQSQWTQAPPSVGTVAPAIVSDSLADRHRDRATDIAADIATDSWHAQRDALAAALAVLEVQCALADRTTAGTDVPTKLEARRVTRLVAALTDVSTLVGTTLTSVPAWRHASLDEVHWVAIASAAIDLALTTLAVDGHRATKGVDTE